MPNKRLAIMFIDKYSDIHNPILCEVDKNDYKHLYIDHKISNKELNKAIKLIYSYSVQHKIKNMICDLGMLDDELTPTKEMTIDEIEKILGYKIKIVQK